MTPNAGILACISGSTLRILLEFLLPKDGSLVAFGTYALNYGRAVAGLPSFMETTLDANAADGLVWNPDENVCHQGKHVQGYLGTSGLLRSDIWAWASIWGTMGS
jgi:hypothetical protein